MFLFTAIIYYIRRKYSTDMFFFGFTTNIITIAILSLFSMVMLYQGFQDKFVDDPENRITEVMAYSPSPDAIIALEHDQQLLGADINESRIQIACAQQLSHLTVLSKKQHGYTPSIRLRGPPLMA